MQSQEEIEKLKTILKNSEEEEVSTPNPDSIPTDVPNMEVTGTDVETPFQPSVEFNQNHDVGEKVVIGNGFEYLVQHLETLAFDLGNAGNVTIAKRVKSIKEEVQKQATQFANSVYPKI